MNTPTRLTGSLATRVPCLHKGVLSALGLCISLAAQTIVLPANAAGVEGAGSHRFPFGPHAGPFPGVRIQQVYDSSNLTSQGITGPIHITGIRWRVNGGAGCTGGVYGSCTIAMASAAFDYTAILTDWVSNQGPDHQICYSGPITVSPATAATPGSWFVQQTLTTPFCYDPTLGKDLIIDCDRAPAWSGGLSTNHDISTVGSLSSRVWSSTAYPLANGIDQNHGLVVELQYVPAPTALTTPPNFVANDQGAIGGVVYFTLEVLRQNGITIDNIAVNTDAAINAPIFANVSRNRATSDWTQLNFTTNRAEDWDVIAMLAGISSGSGAASPMAVHNATHSINLPQGRHLLAIGGGNFRHLFTQGTGSNQSTLDCSLVFRGGMAADAPFATILHFPRVLNATFDYSLSASPVTLSPAVPSIGAQEGRGCGGQPQHVFEGFSGTVLFDLANVDLVITSAGCVPAPQTAIVPPVAPNLGLFDNSSTPFVPLGFHLRLGNDVYNQVSVCSNGYIRFDGRSTGNDASASVAELYGQGARLCPFWDDLSPQISGSIHLDKSPGQVIITYDAVRASQTFAQLTFQVVITPNLVRYRYLPTAPWSFVISALTLVGYGNGHPAPAGSPVDLSAGPTAPFVGPGSLQLLCDQAPALGTALQMTLANNPSAGAVLAQLGVPGGSVSLPPPFGVGCSQNVASNAVSLGIAVIPTATFSINIPTSAAWFGLPLACQGFSLGNTSTFLSSNAVRARVGAY